MPDREYRQSLPAVMFLLSTAMVLGAFAIAIGLSLNIRNEVLTNRANGLVNQGYNRANACIISVSPTRRTPEYVKACYDTAEKETGISVTRYGDAK